MALAVAAGEMTKHRTIQVLQFYPEIDDEIKAVKRILADLEQVYDTSGAINYDGMPKGNNISNQTEERAMIIPDYVRGEIRDYQKRIRELQKLKVEILKEISRMKLTPKNIIFDFYFRGLNWEQVAGRNHYSSRQCKNIRDNAIKYLARRFGKNSVIREFELPEH